jgi:multidrug resistance efflux pump
MELVVLYRSTCMKSARSRLKYWINKRFIFLIEFVGYIVVACIAVTVATSWFWQVERKTYATGSIMPFQLNVTSEEDCVIVLFKVASGDHVNKGDDLCLIAVAPEARLRAQAHAGLNSVISSLEPSQDTGLQRAREDLERVRDQVVGSPDTQPLRAPVSGLIRAPVDIKPGELVTSGKPIVQVLQLDRLVLQGVPDQRDADKIKVGQTARVTVTAAQPFDIEGTVLEKPSGKSAVILLFEPIPDQLKTAFKEALRTGKSPSSARAEIVVGKQKLLSKLFARNR